MIQVDGLTYTYPRTEKAALQNLSLQVHQGEFVGLIGANGAGKSTLCYALSGFVPHFYKGRLSGSLQVAGYAVAETPLATLTAKVGLVFQNPFNQISGARYTVREEVAFGLENLGVSRQEMIDRVEEALEQTGLIDLAENSPFELSGGQQQRLAIASVVVMRPEVLILDEPTSQLDPQGTRELFATLQNLTVDNQTTIVLATHKVEWLAIFADRVIALSDGEIAAADNPQAVLTGPDLLALGVAPTRFTQAAEAALKLGLGKAGVALPITLEQAKVYFDGHPR